MYLCVAVSPKGGSATETCTFVALWFSKVLFDFLRYLPPAKALCTNKEIRTMTVSVYQISNPVSGMPSSLSGTHPATLSATKRAMVGRNLGMRYTSSNFEIRSFLHFLICSLKQLQSWFLSFLRPRSLHSKSITAPARIENQTTYLSCMREATLTHTTASKIAHQLKRLRQNPPKDFVL